jgi:plastocyanin
VIHVSPEASAARTDIPTSVIGGVDYAFKAPATVPPGRHLVAFENQGKVAHEVAIALLRRGVTIDSVLKVEKAGGDVDGMFEPGESGLLTSQPGQKALGHLDVNFLPGREYSIVCFFQDNDKAPPHVALGMVGSIKVTRSGAVQ